MSVLKLNKCVYNAVLDLL